MGKYNFDRYIERRGTDSSKWDGFESRFPGYNASGALPMWVADMDFTAPDEVIRDLIMNVIKECSKGMNITEEKGSLRHLWLSGTKG